MENSARYKSENPVERLYYFKEAAREYLDEYNGVEAVKKEYNESALERMMMRLPYIWEKRKKESEAPAVLARIAAPVTDFLVNIGQLDFAKNDWFRKYVSKEAEKKMVAELKKEDILRKKLNYFLEANTTIKARDGASDVIEDVKETEEVQLFRREILGIIEKSKKISDEEKEKMRADLAGATEIVYVRTDKYKMKYSFGSSAVEGVISDGSVRFGNEQKYSAGGAFDVKTVIKYKNKAPKSILTGKGEALKKKKDIQVAAQKKEDKNALKLKKQIEDKQQEIDKQQEAVRQCFSAAVRSLDVCFLLEEVIRPEGVIAKLAKQHGKEAEWQAAQNRVVANVYQCPEIWQIYSEQKNDDSYNNQSEYQGAIDEELKKGNGLDKLTKAARAISRFIGDDGKSGVEQISDGKLETYFSLQAKELPANIPPELKKEALRQEIFRQALWRSGVFDEASFRVMNRVLRLIGMGIKFEAKKVESKCTLASAKDISKEILDDMHQRGVVQDKHRTEAFLYHVGEYRRQHPDEKLQGYSSGCPFEGVVREFAETYCHRKVIDFTVERDWKCFIGKARNLKQADMLYDMFQKSRVPGVKIDKVVKSLAQGKTATDAYPLIQQSMHHRLYRRFAGLFGDKMKDIKDLFNARGQLIDTIAFHPAFVDMHNDVEHRFDMKEAYLYRRKDGKIEFSTFYKGEIGDTVLMPVVCVKNKEGKFEPLMKEDMLVMTSRGVVTEPSISGDGMGGRGGSVYDV